MSEMPLRVWSSRPTSLWPEAVLTAGFVLVVWTVKTFHVVWAFFPGLLLFILWMRLLNRRRPIPWSPWRAVCRSPSDGMPLTSPWQRRN